MDTYFSRPIFWWPEATAWHAKGDAEGWRFITFLQNHDQVANSARGSRLPSLTAPGINRVLTTLWLLSPGTAMFFMGQEFGTRTPFSYFVDHEVELANLERDGRIESLRQFRVSPVGTPTVCRCPTRRLSRHLLIVGLIGRN